MATTVSRTSTEATTVEQQSFPLRQTLASLDDQAIAAIGIALMDNTTLGDDDTTEKVTKLINSSVVCAPHTAAICVFGKFVAHARSVVDGDARLKGLKIATVVNFPKGTQELEETVAEAKQYVADGADEVDLVIDYKSAISKTDEGWATKITNMVADVKAECTHEDRVVLLKVIIESGELKTAGLIAEVCDAVLAGGCDFVKTSTGKVPVNATIEAARVMLQSIARSRMSNPSKVLGFKAAGGVKTVGQTREFLQAAEDIMGVGWISPSTFRFGASSLLNDLRSVLKGVETTCHVEQNRYDFCDEPLMWSDAQIPRLSVKAGLSNDLALLRMHLDATARVMGRIAAQCLASPGEFANLVWDTVASLKDVRPAGVWAMFKPHLATIVSNSFVLVTKTLEGLHQNPTAKPVLEKLKQITDRPALDAIKEAVVKGVGKYI